MRHNSSRRLFGGLVLAILALTSSARAQEKTILLDSAPVLRGRFEVAADGSRVYLASMQGGFLVLDQNGEPVADVGAIARVVAAETCPLPDGGFISFMPGFQGQVVLLRRDGTEQRALVSRGPKLEDLRPVSGEVPNPTGGTIDPKQQRIFALDQTNDGEGTIFTRVAMYDPEGKYLGEVNRYDRKTMPRSDPKNTWYDDIEVDPSRKRIYLTDRRRSRLLALDYEGRAIAEAPGQGGIAVFPDGRVAVGAGVNQGIQIYSPKLTPITKLDAALATEVPSDLETDATGRLYATSSDTRILFYRWTADLSKRDVFVRRHLHLNVEYPTGEIFAGEVLNLKVAASGKPKLERPSDWYVFARPLSGSDLAWKRLAASYQTGHLQVEVPRDMAGPYEFAVRFGEGAIDSIDSADVPACIRTFAISRRGMSRSVSVFSASGRRSFRQGEPIEIQLALRSDKPGGATVEVSLEAGTVELASVRVEARPIAAIAIPQRLSRRLPPGRYVIRPRAQGFEPYPLEIDVVSDVPDSPMQRILYQEFNTSPTSGPQARMDAPERPAFIRNYLRAASWLGFTRETDRQLMRLHRQNKGWAWRRDKTQIDLSKSSFAVPEVYGLPSMGSWETETYLDQAVRRGISYDSQILNHCDNVPVRDDQLRELATTLQRAVQWMQRFPSFYGINYHDELFFGFNTKEDRDRMKEIGEQNRVGEVEARFLAMERMYDIFRKAVLRVDPAAHLTAAPMWQTPAVEGSYAPSFDGRLSESYTHYLSEGYHLPFDSAHSVEYLRRPALPMMGVCGGLYALEPRRGELYLHDMMQVAGRGVQGVGMVNNSPIDEGLDSDAFRAANTLARNYGPIFAEAPPLNEGAVLYSRTQDFTERRRSMGTPHWERVLTLFAPG